MLKKKSFTLIEIIIVIVIVGILSAIALPNFGIMREKQLDKEAKAVLKLIQAAERIYRMENGSYYSSSNIALINSNLRLGLPDTGTPNWTYALGATSATATRSGRTWLINFAPGSLETATCSGSCL